MGNMAADNAAGKRINSLLDAGSFVEIGGAVTARTTDFNMQEKETPADGVITGYGVIDGNLVYVYSQDATVLNGAIGEMHAKKISNIYDMAMKMGAPVIGLVDCAGFRLQEATDALEAFGKLYQKQSMASGVIPQITAIFGTCGGGLSIVPALTDFTFMETKNGKLSVSYTDLDVYKRQVPYLPIDPKDFGREYDSDVIRINSQSGKGGVNYILMHSHGINLPKAMREEVGYMVKDVSDKAHKELTPDWVYQIFSDHYINTKSIFHIDECHFKQVDGITAEVTINHAGGILSENALLDFFPRSLYSLVTSSNASFFIFSIRAFIFSLYSSSDVCISK